MIFRGRRPTAQEIFYPAAVAYAALMLPLSVVAMLDGSRALEAVAQPAGHAHEMFFGFALAVVAGNQLGALAGGRLLVLFLAWAGARAAFLLSPESVIADLLNAAFPALLAAQIAPRLFASAKKLRNQALPSIITLLCVAAAAWQLGRHWHAGLPPVLPLATLILFAALMLFMGGRIIAPAVAGQLYRQGQELQARVQPRLEAGLLAASAAALAALFVPHGETAAAAAAGAAGVLAFIRAARWRLWAVRGRADLLCLASGYGWLALGLVVLGSSLAVGRLHTAAVHVITVGALGTLTFNVMALSWTLKHWADPARAAEIPWGTALIAAATACRVAGAFYAEPWLAIAAFCWSAAFLLLAVLFWRLRRRA